MMIHVYMYLSLSLYIYIYIYVCIYIYIYTHTLPRPQRPPARRRAGPAAATTTTNASNTNYYYHYCINNNTNTTNNDYYNYKNYKTNNNTRLHCAWRRLQVFRKLSFLFVVLCLSCFSSTWQYYVYMYMYMYMYMCVYIYIYIYRTKHQQRLFREPPSGRDRGSRKRLRSLTSRFKIHQRGVQWKQGVVVYMLLDTSVLYDTTPIHCTPLWWIPRGWSKTPQCVASYIVSIVVAIIVFCMS